MELKKTGNEVIAKGDININAWDNKVQVGVLKSSHYLEITDKYEALHLVEVLKRRFKL